MSEDSTLRVVQKDFDLSPVARQRISDDRLGNWTGGFVGVVALFGVSTLTYLLIVGDTSVPLPYILFSIAILLACGLFFSGVLIHKGLSPQYSKLTVSDEGGTFTKYRGGGERSLRWDTPSFYLRLVKDEWMGVVSNCLEYTDSWAPKVLTEEAHDSILQAARLKQMAIKERRAWSGMRTFSEILPRDLK